jgi:hypothetical protein
MESPAAQHVCREPVIGVHLRQLPARHERDFHHTSLPIGTVSAPPGSLNVRRPQTTGRARDHWGQISNFQSRRPEKFEI